MTQPATPELSSTGSRLLGETVAGNLVIRRFLGADALGECYVCLDEGMAESVRLTLVSEARLESGGAPLRAAFLEAMKTTAGVDHSNVLAVRKIIDDGRDVGAVTKLVEGTTLADYVAEYGALPVEVALDLFLPIADALLTLHEQGIGHGVLRPSSIFVEQRAGRLEPLLMNAGSGPVVKLVPELDLDSESYRAPEADGKIQLADVYAFGATLLFAITGKLPDAAALSTPLVGSEFPEEVVAVVHQSIQANPAARFQSFAAIRNILSGLVAEPEQERKSVERPEPGDEVAGQYIVEKLLGEGGMARVYLAKDKVLGTRVAIKLLNAACLAEPAVVERFLNEASIQAQLVHPEPHPNIVAVHRVLHEEPVGFVMEYVEGTTLEEFLEREVLEESELAEIFSQVFDGLHRAHSSRIVHRDLKPSNILLTGSRSEGFLAKLMDFGISKQLDQPKTKTNLVLGTLGYIAPELFISAKDASPASDIYAIGCCIFEALTGDVPFSVSGGLRSLAFRVYNETPPLASSLGANVSDELECLIQAMLAKKADERPESAIWIRDRLRALAKGERDAELAALMTTVGGNLAEGATGKKGKTHKGTQRIQPGPATLQGTAPTMNTTRAQGLSFIAEVPTATPRRWPILLALLGVLALAGVVVFLFLSSSNEEPKTEAAEQAKPVAKVDPPKETRAPEPVPEKAAEDVEAGHSVLPASVVLNADELLAQARAEAIAGDKRKAVKLYEEATTKLEDEGKVDANATEAYVEMASLYEEIAAEAAAVPAEDADEDIEKLDEDTKNLLASASAAYGKAAAIKGEYELFMKKAIVDQKRGSADSAMDALKEAVAVAEGGKEKKAAEKQLARIEGAIDQGSDSEDKTEDTSAVEPSEMVDVWIESNPERAKVLYNGKRIGKTPLIKRFPRGAEKLNFTLKQDDHYDETIVFDGEVGGKISVKLSYRPRKIH
ncbi:MAG: hypothetical protein AUK47_24035 [Deltaproteobacteria bacterium CG2_30_63_29]|nr:MAG: hypothetical protein AUK47_24035 [Deltaproteobacteria bacterium CG2_30_63_29]PIV99963.1 MAG: hypothetical protein COW42_09355 [Deltaproteobacteria bacterium CG17_big_fil_post_rev_8_21_14_2_50_63_7]PJB35917.1 MAG: hypothetical protein CO108_24625 [Deltaproteobacteria bacterium CG_4_9_14_3_um_filter_63_12]